MARIIRRNLPGGLWIAIGLLALAPGRATAQGARTTVHQPSTEAVEAMLNPLAGRVEHLEGEVERLEAALESLRATVAANRAAYQQHGHEYREFGMTSAKSICPNTNASATTLIAIGSGNSSNTGLTGPPEPAAGGNR
jgi:hypothetical protein